ncbi:hypothetical protein GCM10017711_31060 [Paeniglutamicibacter sulfureus]
MGNVRIRGCQINEKARKGFDTDARATVRLGYPQRSKPRFIQPRDLFEWEDAFEITFPGAFGNPRKEFGKSRALGRIIGGNNFGCLQSNGHAGCLSGTCCDRGEIFIGCRELGEGSAESGCRV